MNVITTPARSCSGLRGRAALLSLAVLLFPWAGMAQTITTWTNTGTGDWFDGTNWTGGVPTSNDEALVRNSGTIVVSDSTAMANEVIIGDLNEGTLLVKGGSLEIGVALVTGFHGGSSGSVTVSGGSVTYDQFIDGYMGSGLMNITGGYVANKGSFDVIGDAAGSSGTMIVSGGTWDNPVALYVGDNGQGELDVTGGYVHTGVAYVGGFPGNVSTATVSSGMWDITTALSVGVQGTGVLALLGTGVVSVAGGTGTVALGEFATGYGTVNISGGTLLAAAIDGQPGGGTVNFEESGSYTFTPALTGSLSVNQTGSGTTVLVTGNTYTGTTTISAGTLLLSGAGSIPDSATINVEHGATLDVTQVTGGTFTVGAGQTLGGGGTVNAETLAVAGAVSPGLGSTTTPQNLTVKGNLSLSGRTSFTFYATGSSDVVTVAGGVLSYGGTLAVTLVGVLGTGTYSYTLFYAASAVGDFIPGGVTVNNAALAETVANTWSGSFVSDGMIYDVTFTNPANSDAVMTVFGGTPVPEPGTWVLLGIGCAGVVLLRPRTIGPRPA